MCTATVSGYDALVRAPAWVGAGGGGGISGRVGREGRGSKVGSGASLGMGGSVMSSTTPGEFGSAISVSSAFVLPVAEGITSISIGAGCTRGLTVGHGVASEDVVGEDDV